MKKINRRDFLKTTVQTGASIMAGSIVGGSTIFAGQSDKVNLTVGYLPITDHLILPVSHARDNNKFSNLNVNPYLCKSWDEMVAKLDMGILQAAFLLSPLAMHQVSHGKRLKCVLFGHTDGSVIATKNSITGADMLKGKTIGIPHKYSTHKVLLYKYMKDRNINMNEDLNLITIPPPLTVKTLKAGRIDGYTVAEPWGFMGVNQGVARILEYSRNILPGHVCCIVMVSRSFIERNEDEIQEWVKSLANAGKYILDNVTQAAEIQKKYMKHNPDDIVQIIRKDMISYRYLSPSRKELARIHDLAVEGGILTKRCDLDDFVDDRFIVS